MSVYVLQAHGTWSHFPASLAFVMSPHIPDSNTHTGCINLNRMPHHVTCQKYAENGGHVNHYCLPLSSICGSLNIVLYVPTAVHMYRYRTWGQTRKWISSATALTSSSLLHTKTEKGGSAFSMWWSHVKEAPLNTTQNDIMLDPNKVYGVHRAHLRYQPNQISPCSR